MHRGSKGPPSSSRRPASAPNTITTAETATATTGGSPSSAAEQVKINNTSAVTMTSDATTLSQAQRDLLERLQTNLDTGLSNDQVTQRREELGFFNTVKPPIDCPPTVCCLLPCIKHVPSMKAFRSMQPEDAEVLRSGTWIRYDVTSLVPGDILRLEEGDGVPADCVVLSLPLHCDELLVDVRAITAEEKPRSAKRRVSSRKADGGGAAPGKEETIRTVQPVQLYWGGTVVQGGCIAVVTATGPQCFVSTLIQAGKFPPPPNVLQTLAGENGEDDEEEAGILLQAVQPQSSEEPMVRETV